MCKTYFLNTLAVSERTVTTAFEKKIEDGIVSPDFRGNNRKEDDAMQQRKNELRKHILSFPRMPSHYCRESSNLLYLSADLTLAKMYELYTNHCYEKKLKPLSRPIYWKTFKSMNLAFHTSKKDRGETCETFRNLSPQEQEEEKITYQQHRQRPEKICAIKSDLKKQAAKAN